MSKPNRLSKETSPYLKQHALNPVDWYPWGKEALDRAKKESKPIFLSIGYSACHWCHVMEKESFEDAATAKLLNEYFISIKVDREERQDLDHIYMSAVQILTQRGGWPMSVFLTPELKPFYGGTYFPPEDRHGLPSFKKVLMGVAGAWQNRRDEIENTANQLTQALSDFGKPTEKTAGENLSTALLDNAAKIGQENFDPEFGGFGSSPKFFHPMELRNCLRHWKRTSDPLSLEVVNKTLTAISQGGIYDHLGGGFHRYSTDRIWLAPHFEKMLYDNALLAQVYLEAYQATKNALYAQVAREVLDYVLREMTSEEGGFYSTQDADTEGVEGKFYTFKKAEITGVLESDLAETFCKIYDVSEHGNWEETNILRLLQPLSDSAKDLNVDLAWLEDSLAAARRKLLAVRAQRTLPHRDEKVICSWNGLMIEAFALGYQVLEDDRYLAAAQNAAKFILNKMGPGPEAAGPLLHTYKEGKARLYAYLDDYSCLINGFISLYEADFSLAWLKTAQELTKTMLAQFFENGTFYFTAKNHEALITRPKEFQDGATPSGTSMAITALVRLGRLCSKNEWVKYAEQALGELTPYMKASPHAVGQSLIALGILIDEPKEIVVAVADEEEKAPVLRAIREKFLPSKVIALAAGKEADLLIPMLTDKKTVNGKATVYICEDFSCQSPLVGLENIESGF